MTVSMSIGTACDAQISDQDQEMKHADKGIWTYLCLQRRAITCRGIISHLNVHQRGAYLTAIQL